MILDLHALNRWVPAERDFITLEPEACVGCGSCVRACVARIWSQEAETQRAVLAPDYRQRCLECGACDQVCDTLAIRFRYPPGGTGVVFEQG